MVGKFVTFMNEIKILTYLKLPMRHAPLKDPSFFGLAFIYLRFAFAPILSSRAQSHEILTV